MRNYYKYLLILPGVLFLTIFMLVPIGMTIISTFFPNEAAADTSNYASLFRDSYFLEILWTTLRVSLLTTILCMVIGFPAAYFIARLSAKMKAVLLILTIFPLLTSPVVRSFSWMVIIGRNGLVNEALMGTGIIQEPLEILYTPTAVIIGLVHLFLPLTIITLVGVMESIESDLLTAAASLGASRFGVFTKVVLPLCVPGLVIGAILVFVGSFTAYTTPALLGGQQRVLSTLLYQNANTLNDWHMASILAAIMIVVTLIVITCMNLLANRLNPRR
ncbi:ABC transporter permease [Terribacillus goriensis]|uniref:ABC transporter permease n=1 Tax=Terribacillus saccharophilus TaxID=361277 RepID=UPI0039839AE5